VAVWCRELRSGVNVTQLEGNNMQKKSCPHQSRGTIVVGQIQLKSQSYKKVAIHSYIKLASYLSSVR
jgi:hypothetical protein